MQGHGSGPLNCRQNDEQDDRSNHRRSDGGDETGADADAQSTSKPAAEGIKAKVKEGPWRAMPACGAPIAFSSSVKMGPARASIGPEAAFNALRRCAVAAAEVNLKQ